MTSISRAAVVLDATLFVVLFVLGNVQAMIGDLGKHTSDLARDAAFAELSRRVGMVLDQRSQD